MILERATSTRIRQMLLDNRVIGRFLHLASNSYRRRWNLASLTEASAMDSILAGVSGPDQFESRGKADAEILKRFFGRDSVILDFGCGIGRVDKYLAPFCKKIYAVDVSDRMLMIARKRLSSTDNIELCRTNGRDLSRFSDETFDLVFALLVFLHLDKLDVENHLREIFRVLKNGGTAYLQFPNLSSRHFSIQNLRKRRYDVGRTRWYTEAEVNMLLRKVNLQVAETSYDDSQITQICRKQHSDVL